MKQSTSNKKYMLLSGLLLAALLAIEKNGVAEARLTTTRITESSSKKAKKNKKSKKNKRTRKTKFAVEEDEKQTIGLALSGGSFPSAAVAGGILRGFQRQTILIDDKERPAMEGFDYLTAISGGNVALILYAYAPETTANEVLDVDGIGHPSEITKEELQNIPEGTLFSLLSGSTLPQIAHALFTAALFQDDFAESFLHKRFLEPFGVSRFQPIGNPRDDVKATPMVMTSVVGPAEISPDYVLSGQMGKKFTEGLFSNETNLFRFPEAEEFPHFEANLPSGEIVDGRYFFRMPKKHLINSNDAIWEFAKEASFQLPYGAYITPDEFIMPIQEHRATYDPIGNKTADPVDFIPFVTHPDLVVQDQPPVANWKMGGKKFSLAKMFSAGTNLLSMIQGDIPESWQPLLLRPNVIEIPTANGSKRKVALSDGGYNDLNGIPSLVKKGTRTIICNLFRTRYHFNGSVDKAYLYTLTDLARLFGVVSFPGGPFINAHMFDLNSNNENQLNKFVESVESLRKAGEPMIVTLKDLDVLENKFWGIEGGGKVDLTVIVNVGVPKKFSEQVPYSAVPPAEGKNFTDDGFFTNPDVQYVPNMWSFNGSPEIDIPALNYTAELPLPELALGPEEVRMTEILCSWMIEHAWDGLVGDDGEVKFEGFRKIFEGL